MVLAEDFTGDGQLELIVSSMNGMIYCLTTDIPANPLRTW